MVYHRKLRGDKKGGWNFRIINLLNAWYFKIQDKKAELETFQKAVSLDSLKMIGQNGTV